MKLDKSTSSSMVVNRIKEKTWKREVAVALLVFLGYVSLTQPIELVEVLVYPVFTFALLAFGLDWKGKIDARSTEQDAG